MELKTSDPGALTIYISYNNCNQENDRSDDVRKLANYLHQEKNLNVLLDVREMESLASNSMAKEIAGADIFLIHFTEACNRGNSCEDEIRYAHRRNKPILGVRMEDNCQPRGLLVFLAKDKLWADFPNGKEVAKVANELVEQFYRLFDKANGLILTAEGKLSTTVNLDKFKVVGITPQVYNCPNCRIDDYKQKKELLQNKVCRLGKRTEGGLVVLAGPEGIGKTYFINWLCLENANRVFLMSECEIGAVIRIDCGSWSQDADFNQKNVQETLQKMLAKVTKRGKNASLSDHLRILTENLHASPIIVFDNVYSFKVLAFLRDQCRSPQNIYKHLPCIAITRQQSFDVEQNHYSGSAEMQQVHAEEWEKLVPILVEMKPLTDPGDLHPVIKEVLGGSVSQLVLIEMAAKSAGIPGRALELAKRLLNGPSHHGSETNTPRSVTVKTTKDNAPTLKIYGVGFFDCRFPRPAEEDLLREGLKSLCSPAENNENGFTLMVRGPGGIGKTSLIANFLRNEHNNTFFQSECNLQVVFWVNCCQWPQGLGENNARKDFEKQLLHLGSQAAPEMKEGFKTLRKMSEHFSLKKLRVLFVLDDLLHLSILEKLRDEWPGALCLVLTPEPSKLSTKNFTPFIQGSIDVAPLSDRRILKIFKEPASGLKDNLTGEQLRELVKYSYGSPMLVAFICDLFRDCDDCETRYSKLDSKLSTSGNGVQQTVAKLLEGALETLPKQDQNRYFALLLFSPQESIDEDHLRLLWECKDVKEVRAICTEWDRLSIIRDVTDPQWQRGVEMKHHYLLHQLLHDQATEMLVKKFGIKVGKGVNPLSEIRVRILANLSSEGEGNGLASSSNLLKSMRQLDGCLKGILSRIDPEAFHFANTWAMLTADFFDSPENEKVFRASVATGQFYLVKYFIGDCTVPPSFFRKFFGACLKRDSATHPLDPKIAAQCSSALHLAAKKGYVDILQLLMDNGAEVNAITKDGWTALIAASSNGHCNIVRLLLDKGADVNAGVERHIEGKEVNYPPALMWAASAGHSETVKMLLLSGATVDVVDKDGWSALILAARNGHVETVRLLLDAKANVNLPGGDGRTALMWAASSGHQEVVKLLIDRNADADLLDKDGKSAWMLAEQNGLDKTVQMLHS